MTSRTIPVYWEGELSPKARDTIEAIVREGFPEYDISLVRWLDSDRKILVLGKITNPDMPKDIEYVFTYSIPQIMTKANAATVVCAAVRQFIEGNVGVDFDYPLMSSAMRRLGFDMDAPTVIDIETSGNLGKDHTPEEVYLLTVAFYQKGMRPYVLVSSKEDDSEKWTNPLHANQLAELAEILPKFTKAIYHNGKFDIRVLERVLGVKLTNWFDTMLAHHVLNQAAGNHKLKDLAKLYFGAPDWEADIKQYTKGGGHYELIPRARLVMYGAYDVFWTYKLYEMLAPLIEADEEAQKAFMLEMAAADFLLDVEKHGIPFDQKYATEFGEKLLTEKDKCLMYLRGYAADKDFNPNSPKQVKTVLAKRGIIVATTDEDMMNLLLETYKHDEWVQSFVKALLKYRKASKMYSTYVQGWRKVARNGRVHPTFLVHGTSTGRLSSSSPNAQNFPRDKEVRRLVAITDA